MKVPANHKKKHIKKFKKIGGLQSRDLTVVKFKVSIIKKVSLRTKVEYCGIFLFSSDLAHF